MSYITTTEFNHDIRNCRLISFNIRVFISRSAKVGFASSWMDGGRDREITVSYPRTTVCTFKRRSLPVRSP